MPSSSNAKLQPMRVTPRDMELLVDFWRARELFADDVRALAFDRSLPDSGNAPHRSVAYRRLGTAVRNGLLAARRVPALGSVGACPLLYTLGPEAAPLLAMRLGLAEEQVRRRITADSHLTEHFRGHRQAITSAYRAVKRACQDAGYDLDWESDEDLACRRLAVIDRGVSVPIRPDARLSIGLPGRGRTGCFLEVQRTSRPSAFRLKLRGYLAGCRQRVFQREFGVATPRVLGLVDSEPRARNLQTVAEELGTRGLVWATTLRALAQDPFGSIWFVAGQGCERKPLLGGGATCNP